MYVVFMLMILPAAVVLLAVLLFLLLMLRLLGSFILHRRNEPAKWSDAAERDEAGRIGRIGEELIGEELERVAPSIGGGGVLRNAYVPKEGGGTSEVDVLFITSRGVFVIESKNFSGWIFGDEADRNWTQCLEGGQRNRFYNPIRQNRSHIRWLGRYLGGGVPLYSLVVFSERCELKKVTVESADVAVIQRGELGRTVRRIWEGAEGAGPVDVDGVYRRLEPLTHADAETRAAHVEEARAAAAAARGVGRAGIANRGAADSTETGPKHVQTEPVPVKELVAPMDGDGARTPAPNDAAGGAAPAAAGTAVPAMSEISATEVAGIADGDAPCKTAPEDTAPSVPARGSAPEVAPAPQPPLCPRCGRPLVVRTARHGATAGGRFYGCSGYPSCRYTRSL